MNFGYMLRFAAISAGVGLGTAVGCGGANSSDLLDPSGTGPGGDGGGNPGFDGGGGRDTGTVDTGTDADEPEEDASQPLRGVRCDNGSGTQKLCSGGQPLCCISANFIGAKSYACLGAGGDCQPSTNRWSMRCDSNDDCTQGRRCCGHLTDSGGTQHFDRISCDATERCGADSLQVCTTDDDCRGGDRCQGTDPENSVYRFCQ